VLPGAAAELFGPQILNGLDQENTIEASGAGIKSEIPFRKSLWLCRDQLIPMVFEVMI
jgi:hypothetical protein